MIEIFVNSYFILSNSICNIFTGLVYWSSCRYEVLLKLVAWEISHLSCVEYPDLLKIKKLLIKSIRYLRAYPKVVKTGSTPGGRFGITLRGFPTSLLSLPFRTRWPLISVISAWKRDIDFGCRHSFTCQRK